MVWTIRRSRAEAGPAGTRGANAAFVFVSRGSVHVVKLLERFADRCLMFIPLTAVPLGVQAKPVGCDSSAIPDRGLDCSAHSRVPVDSGSTPGGRSPADQ